ncbi:hypothetical protein M0R88_14825 [Halorussus gelatinilyticus]|uniref:Uncharacterized protein n=1 Tax=Halorussus gelatinilyticus TaxID=2937524 RepID=A0A8U0IGG6_9EURY|nr:hypothetical protein [Halorussus gelatinilyticus]UPV99780.1 hypothetical protein M0R88_14825 [Halorussus gelatinilyticus]
MCGEERRGSQKATARFRHRLADLKRNGCNILLVGTDALDAACERLLGESSAGPRYRLFVTADSRPPTAYARLRSVQSGPYSDSAAVVNWEADVRGGSATENAPAGSGPFGEESFGDGSLGERSPGGESLVEESPGESVRDGSDASFYRTTVESDELRDLGRTIEETAETLEAESGGLSSAELRLCFDSIVPLVADYDERTVRRFLLGVTETVERFDGMAHYHLPAEYDSETVDAVEALFDAVVEVQYGPEEIEQRWHLAEPDVTTDWLAL